MHMLAPFELTLGFMHPSFQSHRLLQGFTIAFNSNLHDCKRKQVIGPVKDVAVEQIRRQQ